MGLAMGALRRRAARLAAACVFVSATFLSFATTAVAAEAGRTVTLVSPIERDPALDGRLPPTYSPDALRRELEVALETTGLFTVASRDKHDLDPVLRELALSKHRPHG